MIIINDDYRDHEKPDMFRYIIQGNVYRIALQYTRLNRFKLRECSPVCGCPDITMPVGVPAMYRRCVYPMQ